MGAFRMFWRRRGRSNTEAVPTAPTVPAADDAEEQEQAAGEEQAPEQETGDAGATPDETGPIELERDALRPIAIQHAAEELSRRGDRVVELFKEIRSPKGRTNFAIHLKRGSEPEEDVFVEVATGPWDDEAVRNAVRAASILRESDQADASLEFLSAYPLPDEVRFFEDKSTASLFLLDLVQGDDLDDPEACAESFREAANRQWGLNLDYGTDGLPLIEELVPAALNEKPEGTPPRIRDPLVHGLGCYMGETLRRHSPQGGWWHRAEEWGEGIVLEFPDLTADPIGQARSFVENGPEDSLAFYVNYVLGELGETGSKPEALT